jgi:hypothetical protein
MKSGFFGGLSSISGNKSAVSKDLKNDGKVI